MKLLVFLLIVAIFGLGGWMSQRPSSATISQQIVGRGRETELTLFDALKGLL